MGGCSWVDRKVGNWYHDFIADSARSDRSKASDTAFASELQTFVSSPAGQRFSSDVVLSLDANGVAVAISGTRSMYLMKPTKTGGEDIELSQGVRECVKDVTLDAFPFFRAFLYFDGLALMEGETIRNICVAGLCVFLVSVVMLGDVVAAFLVLSMIGLVDICILGYMSHWNLDFNSVTAINLVLAVGLAVDYSAHITHSFLVSKGSGLERAKHAVDHIGASVFNGAFSTFLAVLPLGLSKSYVFQVFFKMWFMIVIFGTYFGIIVLPLVLRLASPLVGQPESSEMNADGKTKVEPDSAIEVQPNISGKATE
jgi:hypothetical protein